MADNDTLVHLAKLVEIADDHSPFRPSCLRKSLILAWLLKTRHIATTMKIGVAKTHDHLQAHAWLEVSSSPALRFFDDPSFVDLATSHHFRKVIA